MDILWTQLWYETIMDIWGKWTNLIAWWTLVHYNVAFKMDKETVFPPFGIYHSKQCYHSRLLWFKIITVSIQTDIAEKPNTRYKEDASNTDHRSGKTSPFHQTTKQTWHRLQQTLVLEIGCCACFAKNKATRTKFKCPECSMGLCATPCFGVFALICISKDQLTLTLSWKSRAHTHT